MFLPLSVEKSIYVLGSAYRIDSPLGTAEPACACFWDSTSKLEVGGTPVAAVHVSGEEVLVIGEVTYTCWSAGWDGWGW